MNAHDVQVLFCDLQPQIVARSKTNPPDSLAASAEVLANVARILNLPMTFSVVPEAEKEPEIISGLAPFASPSTTFPRASASPFLDKRTVEVLSAHKRNTLVISGFATEVVSLHTALAAIAEGYSVQLPVDANGGMSSRSEDAAFRQIERAGGVVTSVVSLATAIAPDFATSPGKETFQELQALRLS
jgi:5,10-methenyltetrahydromethanopterin hydrogenase